MKRNIPPHSLETFEDAIPDLQKLREKIQLGNDLAIGSVMEENRENFCGKIQRGGWDSRGLGERGVSGGTEMEKRWGSLRPENCWHWIFAQGQFNFHLQEVFYLLHSGLYDIWTLFCTEEDNPVPSSPYLPSVSENAFTLNGPIHSTSPDIT